MTSTMAMKMPLLSLSLMMLLNHQSPIRFSKSGQANASWRANVDRNPTDSDWSVRSSNLPGDVTGFAKATLESTIIKELPLDAGLKKALASAEEISIEQSFGLQSLLTGRTPPKRQTDTPSLPVNTVDLPMPPTSDSTIIVIKESVRGTVEGKLSKLTMEVSQKTRGFVFQMPELPCEVGAPSTSSPFPTGELEIPDDAASFVVEQAGVNTVELSHPILVRTDRQLVVVLEHVVGVLSSAYGQAAGVMPNTCPMKVVEDATTNGLTQRAVEESLPNSEDIVAQVYGGVYSENTGSYLILKDRFAQPHRMAMQFLLKVGYLTNLMDKRSAPAVYQNDDGTFSLIYSNYDYSYRRSHTTTPKDVGVSYSQYNYKYNSKYMRARA